MNDDVADEELSALLFRAATLAIAIRRRYEVLRVESRYFVYVLLLQQGKLYVGSTNNPYTRLYDHYFTTSSSAAWVREWGPPVRVVELLRNCRDDDEQYKYMEYASMFGWENVRGGSSCRVIMDRPPPGLATFERDFSRTFEHVPRTEIEQLVRDALSLEKR